MEKNTYLLLFVDLRAAFDLAETHNRNIILSLKVKKHNQTKLY